ncbi:type 1 glutamine amidotransferase [Nesterenkonia alkaliphila]|uniref:Lipid II isoglutaminyl synthase (glutamine-hydrolyzing) subunit GatD n=1 Tax=Nesterenkonia alkaliphila TaxID=1463631 RepID=A0A7K1UMG0_9MICC|nr:glutamine amidotransferase [Nesterenkonia alkaliphila]MVT27675.1 glutamine amidotransferase [Nesterenkonia alkaliphila]GFZ87947.1 glutamine amidotransferase [Nesterenkonia alkaliphila]
MKQIRVLQLYPRDMNIYGDYGNTLVLQRRLQWYGYEPVMLSYNPGEEFPTDPDILIGGGGQDSGQDRIQADLLGIGERLHALAEQQVPMLMICGLYQLFGHFFETRAGRRIQGIGILDVETYGTDKRLIGNVVAESDEFGTVIGYENHSGQTYLGDDAAPLAAVTTGEGNNQRDAHEGARQHNVLGSYLHGSLLPKNPAIADFLISTAVQQKFGEQLGELASPASSPLPLQALTERARQTASSRPR